MLRLHNTLTRTIEPIRPLAPGTVSMYSCGPTVYRPVHIGNLRSFLLGDLIRRALAWTGLSVRQVMNITDVGHMTDEIYDRGEDKMLLAAADEGLSPEEIAAKYEAAFHRDAGRLGIIPAEVYPRASAHIAEMIDLIGRLLDRGHAYVDAGTVYYDVTTFPDYGRLSRNSLDQLRAGHRLAAVDHHKRHPADFILWKAAGPRRVVRFDSPWGEGYPGWHIECSAMSIAYLGERFDVHTGGVDLAFPHHEDEIAQSEGALGHPVVSMWVHGDHLLFSGQKMAKSSGNVWTLDRLEEEGHHPLDFRYLCLTSRYRRQLRFSPDATGATRPARRRARRPRSGTCASATLSSTTSTSPGPSRWCGAWSATRRSQGPNGERCCGTGTGCSASASTPPPAPPRTRSCRPGRPSCSRPATRPGPGATGPRATGCGTPSTNWASRCPIPGRARPGAAGARAAARCGTGR